MKKLLAILLALVFVFSFAACSEKEDAKDGTTVAGESADASTDGNEKYSIKTDPEIISLRKGYACEFEISLTPFCSFEIEDELMIVSIDILRGTKTTIPLKISIKTDESTRLDYDDLKLDKKLL